MRWKFHTARNFHAGGAPCGGLAERPGRADPDSRGLRLKGPGGRRVDGDYRVTACEPPILLAFEVVAGPVRPTGRYELTADGATATKLTFTLDAQPKGLMKLMRGRSPSRCRPRSRTWRI